MPLNPDYPTFKIIDEPARSDAPPDVASPIDEASPAADDRPKRGIGWVLRWSTTLATISFSLLRLVDFGYQASLEHTLNNAARAGAMEATLPRASAHTVLQTVERRLGRLNLRPGEWDIHIDQNGEPVSGPVSAKGGDALSVVVTLSGGTTLPGWLRGLNLWSEDRPVAVRSEQTIPGRALPAKRSH